ncbi:GH24129 [Drosophila grimshawi]|uniref:tetrahydrofolate synthase n=2 Tax=Drosophila grimshawi TaxID=7222 RepID=B4JNJ0_DROGR|nr:GH24129 [Drosophila grimshawi]
MTKLQKPECESNGRPKAGDAQREKSLRDLVFYPQGKNCEQENDQDNAAYMAAIEVLTTLQPNKDSIRNSIDFKTNSIGLTKKYLFRSGLTLEDVEKLSIIHVSGTKGKGSTCALVESILRQYGARTGFFSSPHLQSTNERIRINGDPLVKPKFTHFFWQVYNRLKNSSENHDDMPPFFMFLTIMGFHVFIAERVDVVVVEVGLGGEKDCTNIVRNVKTIGITSLALEHTELLGTTLPEVAWQKAGIIKPYAHVYTHVTQAECLKIIYDRAAKQQAKVTEVLSTEAYFKYNHYSDFLDSCNDYIRLNGALAIQLAYDWLRQTKGHLHRDYAVNEAQMSAEVLRGLTQTHWPGRCQLVSFKNLRLHLDGAHTVESIRVCGDWFRKCTRQSQNPKILVFNRTGNSDTTAMLLVLQQLCDFDMICFVPNLANRNPMDPNQTALNCSTEEQLERTQLIARKWLEMCEATNQPNRGRMYSTVLDAFIDVRTRYPTHIELDVLITGSIHLLGAVITALDDFNIEVQPTAAAAATATDTTTATTATTTPTAATAAIKAAVSNGPN